jgi:hypothetical protein
MDGWKTWRKCILAALGAAGLMILAATDLRAEMMHGPTFVGLDSVVKGEACLVNGQWSKPIVFTTHHSPLTTHHSGKSLLAALRQEWKAIREELTRGLLETTLTMFFIRGGSPPPSNDQGQLPPPVDQAAGPPPPPPPPPPPTGTGEDTPGDMGNPPPVPPQGTPEPASIVTALLGAGLASLCGSRKWRRKKVK